MLLVEVRLFYAVLVVVTDPHVALLVEIFGAAPTLLSAKRRQIEIVIGADEQIAAARISRVGVKDVVALAHEKRSSPAARPS